MFVCDMIMIYAMIGKLDGEKAIYFVVSALSEEILHLSRQFPAVSLVHRWQYQYHLNINPISLPLLLLLSHQHPINMAYNRYTSGNDGVRNGAPQEGIIKDKEYPQLSFEARELVAGWKDGMMASKDEGWHV